MGQSPPYSRTELALLDLAANEIRIVTVFPRLMIGTIAYWVAVQNLGERDQEGSSSTASALADAVQVRKMPNLVGNSGQVNEDFGGADRHPFDRTEAGAGGSGSAVGGNVLRCGCCSDGT